MFLKRIILFFSAILFLNGCSDDLLIPIPILNSVWIQSKVVVDGENNKIVDSYLDAEFSSGDSEIDSVLINGIKLYRKNKDEYYLEDNLNYNSSIELQVFNFLGHNIDTLVQQMDSIRFDGIKYGDTISKSEITEIKYNKNEENFYTYNIVDELEYGNPNYNADSIYLERNSKGIIKLGDDELDNLPSNQSYILAIEGTKYIDHFFDKEINSFALETESKYQYYIKFYLTD